MHPSEIRQMEVRWVDFPFSDGSENKKRPSLIVSNDSYNRGPDVLAVSVTSNLAARPYAVVMNERHFSQGKLPMESRVRADKLYSFERRQIGPVIGRVSTSFFALVVKQIRLLIEEK